MFVCEYKLFYEGAIGEERTFYCRFRADGTENDSSLSSFKRSSRAFVGENVCNENREADCMKVRTINDAILLVYF